jgi:cytochrome c-type biogenesis protein CcmH
VRRALLTASLLLALAAPARAVTPDEQLPDPALEARARHVSEELRCVVCQNQSVDESDAPLAHDIRVLLRQRIAAGDTDAQAKAYLSQRYGSFVLMKPPMKADTLLLWFGPLLVLIVGGFAVAGYLRGRRAPDLSPPLDPAEEAEVAKILSPELDESSSTL